MRFRILIVIILLTSFAILSAWGAKQSTKATPAPSHNAGGNEMASGQELFKGTCAACHGPTAEGINGLGPNLIRSAFVHDTSDEDLLNFIKTGRPVDNPANTTGIPMPARGGNQNLSDEEIQHIIAYLRSKR